MFVRWTVLCSLATEAARTSNRGSHEKLATCFETDAEPAPERDSGPDRAGICGAAAAGFGELYADRSLLQYHRRLRDRTPRPQLDGHGRRVPVGRHAPDHRYRGLLPAVGAGPIGLLLD